MNPKKTKIVCTLGPASEDVKILTKMVLAGMNVARLNFSHGNYANFEKIIKNVRAVSKASKIPVAIMQDLQGPKMRVGELPPKGILLKKNSIIILTTKNIKAANALIPIQYKHLPKEVKKGERILLCDGFIELKVISKNKTDIKCKVVQEGTVFTHKGLNAPESDIKSSPITEKDIEDLKFGLKHKVDFVAFSFVKNAKNVEELRKLIRAQKSETKIIAKIERKEAVKNLEEIISAADGVMVARGDLGVELNPEKVPIIQKKIILLANTYGKPVITATEMLQSMIENPRATRAEVSDTANAVFDHTDAIMLSNESAVGKFPVQAVETLAKVAVTTEEEMQNYQMLELDLKVNNKLPVSYATCLSAAEMAREIKADLIVAVSNSGFTARNIAKHRLPIPVVALTMHENVKYELQLSWGINHILVAKLSSLGSLKAIRNLLLKNKLATKGQRVVVASNLSREEKNISTIII